MKLKRKTLNKIIFGLLYEAKKFNNKKTSEIEFNWGKYKDKHADEQYMIADDESSLGDTQRKGDPFTYKSLGDKKYKVVSGPSSLAKSIGATLKEEDITGKKSTSETGGGSSPDVYGGENDHIEILNFDNIDEIKSKIEELKQIRFILKEDEGSNEVVNGMVNVVSKGKAGKLEYSKYKDTNLRYSKVNPKYFRNSTDAKEYNKLIEEIKELHSKMIAEYFNKMSKFIEKRMDSSSMPTKAPMNFISEMYNTLINVSGQDVVINYLDELKRITPGMERVVDGTLYEIINKNYIACKKISESKPGSEISDAIGEVGIDIETFKDDFQ